MTAAQAGTARQRMVDEQLRGRGIRDLRVLAAMARLPRERFVDEARRERAYDDTPLPIGLGQTISQPWIVARMLELAALSGSERVLDVGAGSGYQTALLSDLAREVYAIERLPDLARAAAARLEALGCRNVAVATFDGTYGWREHAQFDAILVAAGAPSIPALLIDQLAEGGRLVIPVGPRELQRLARITRAGERFTVAWDSGCTFVDLVGRFGWGGAGPARA
ncbi:MAG: protein-L-isoaspartate(D-aspartate) O-methyltransferase [Myxococcales bacterium]|nr:protein-L-isoaspartate(D-aspartate) O-methyltransferase [Myxococcales bacterium]